MTGLPPGVTVVRSCVTRQDGQRAPKVIRWVKDFQAVSIAATTINPAPVTALRARPGAPKNNPRRRGLVKQELDFTPRTSVHAPAPHTREQADQQHAQAEHAERRRLGNGRPAAAGGTRSQGDVVEHDLAFRTAEVRGHGDARERYAKRIPTRKTGEPIAVRTGYWQVQGGKHAAAAIKAAVDGDGAALIRGGIVKRKAGIETPGHVHERGTLTAPPSRYARRTIGSSPVPMAIAIGRMSSTRRARQTSWMT